MHTAVAQLRFSRIKRTIAKKPKPKTEGVDRRQVVSDSQRRSGSRPSIGAAPDVPLFTLKMQA